MAGHLFHMANLPLNSRSRATLFVGIDLSKAHLEVAAQGLHLKVPNSRTGFAEMVTAVRALKRRTQYAWEADRVHGRALQQYLATNKCRFSPLSAFKVRQFAKATGRMAKTDYIDAEVIAEYATTFRPPPVIPWSNLQARLIDVMRRRNQLICAIRDQKMQVAQIWDKDLKEDGLLLIKSLATSIRQLEGTAEDLVKSCPKTAAKYHVLCRVPGIATKSAIQLLAEMPELGTLNRRQVAALAGLAPVNWESGTSSGTRHIRGGRQSLRTSIYMAAQVAARFNPVLSEFFDRLRAHGKPYRVAIVAVMRKLLIYLNRLVREAPDTPPAEFVPTKKCAKWTAEDDAELLQLSAAGVPMKLMCQTTGRTLGAIRARLAPGIRQRREAKKNPVPDGQLSLRSLECATQRRSVRASLNPSS
jgi:transposase